jgi:hypothetical protein
MTEVAILIGLQAAGKTMFYPQRLAGTHRHVSKELMPHNRNRQRRQLQLIAEALDAGGDNVAVDNTSPSPEDWRPIIDLARRHGAVASAAGSSVHCCRPTASSSTKCLAGQNRRELVALWFAVVMVGLRLIRGRIPRRGVPGHA